MNKGRRAILLIPVEITLFWEVLFIFYWLILIGMNAPREFVYNGETDWGFIILIAVLFTTLTTPIMSIVVERARIWLDYRAEQIELGNRKANRILQWLSNKTNTEKRVERYMKKHDRGDRWYKSR